MSNFDPNQRRADLDFEVKKQNTSLESGGLFGLLLSGIILGFVKLVKFGIRVPAVGISTLVAIVATIAWLTLLR